jgi:hypothetical protein
LAARRHGVHQHDRGRQTLPPPSFVERSLLAQRVESTRFRIGVNIDSDDGCHIDVRSNAEMKYLARELGPTLFDSDVRSG